MIFETLLYLFPPASFIIFGAGVVAGYLLSSHKRQEYRDLEYAYEELNNILFEKENEIERLQKKLARLPNAKNREGQEPSDDFTRIEGIGPKIEQLLKSQSIDTFSKLANTDVQKLSDILEEGGSAFKRHDPHTWPGQAQLAAKGDWKALEAWQKSK